MGKLSARSAEQATDILKLQALVRYLSITFSGIKLSLTLFSEVWYEHDFSCLLVLIAMELVCDLTFECIFIKNAVT